MCIFKTCTKNTLFLFRFTESDVQGRYSAVREVMGQHVRRAATIVNQTLLLCRLHDTRTCDSLLEPISEDHVNSDDGIKNYDSPNSDFE